MDLVERLAQGEVVGFDEVIGAAVEPTATYIQRFMDSRPWVVGQLRDTGASVRQQASKADAQAEIDKIDQQLIGVQIPRGEYFTDEEGQNAALGAWQTVKEDNQAFALWIAFNSLVQAEQLTPLVAKTWRWGGEQRTRSRPTRPHYADTLGDGLLRVMERTDEEKIKIEAAEEFALGIVQAGIRTRKEREILRRRVLHRFAHATIGHPELVHIFIKLAAAGEGRCLDVLAGQTENGIDGPALAFNRVVEAVYSDEAHVSTQDMRVKHLKKAMNRVIVAWLKNVPEGLANQLAPNGWDNFKREDLIRVAKHTEGEIELRNPNEKLLPMPYRAVYRNVPAAFGNILKLLEKSENTDLRAAHQALPFLSSVVRVLL